MTTTKKLIIIAAIVGAAGTIGYFVYTGIKKKTEEGEAETEAETKAEDKPASEGKTSGAAPSGKTPIQNATLRPGSTVLPSGKLPISTVSGKLPFPIKTTIGRRFDGLQFSAEGSSWNNN